MITTTIACDVCGKVIDQKRDRYQTVYVYDHNYPPYTITDPEPSGPDVVCCDDCAAYMWHALRSLRNIRKAKLAAKKGD